MVFHCLHLGPVLRYFYGMGQYSIGEAINRMLEESRWKPVMHEQRICNEWEQIVGKTVARYTRSITLNGTTLIISTSVAALKQELLLSKPKLITHINEYLGAQAVAEIMIR